MRRTYRSKKDTHGALDHRDVLLNTDEKISAFDAFYIQNIKQTKRELSCVASSNLAGVPSNRVRKRKYVKRIVKDVEPVRESDTMSSSTFLTPDKSIRVNKILDPFDMLLNSSPANDEPPRVTADIFVPKKESKTYGKKRRPRVKKFNYSSSESTFESNKENTINSNVTNIKTHELLVEEAPIDKPKKTDDSIQKIFSNLPLLCNLKSKNSSGSFNTSYKNKNRLSKAYMSPALQKSPLCSTPFKEKYRGVSIFKFSPITRKGEQSPVQEIVEENNDSNHSIILISKSLARKKSDECRQNALAVSFASVRNESNLLIDNEIDGKHNASTQNKEQSKMKFVNDQKKDEFTAKIDDTSSLQLTEAEPFLGFSKNEANNLSQVKMRMLSCFDESLILQNNTDKDTGDLQTNRNNSVYDSKHKSLESTQSESDSLASNGQDEEVTDISNLRESYDATKSSCSSNKCNTSDFSQSESSENASQYDTCNSDENDTQTVKEPIVVIEKIDDSVFFKYYEKMIGPKDDNISEHNDDDDFFEILANDSTVEHSDKSTMSDDCNVTKYKLKPIVLTDSSTTDDIISTEEQDVEETEKECEKEDRYISFVTTRRRHELMKDSMFMFDQSYGSSTECDNTVLSNNIISTDYSKNIDTLEKTINEEPIANSESVKTDDLSKNMCLDLDVVKSSNTVISKRGYGIVNDLDLSETSTNNKIAIISNRKSSRLSRQSNASSLSKERSPTNKRISKITTRKSSRLPKRSYSISSESENEKTIVDTNEKEAITKNVSYNKTIQNESILENNQKLSLQLNNSIINPERYSYIGAEGKLKPGIVLQPGKKWERSLSIYRRLTMAESMDHSILEESMQNKGRKYRQSVIHTMEMQEGRDSLHNDSINSRRSSFLSNAHRPTIRFVKDPNFSRVSLNSSSVIDDLKGYLSEECDDTVIELSKLSIADSEHEVTVLDNFHETERVTTAKDFVLRRCNQTESILFDECYPETVLKNCHKIGEGVYGEVFLWRARDGRARVMKIVPIAGTVRVNGEPQKDFHEIISEIVIAMELSALRAPIADIERQLDEGNDIHALDLHHIENATDIFNEVLAVRCVYGPYPARLLDLWELYDECKGSENDNPAALPADQRYIVLELANAGQDLESFQFASAQQAHALFQQIAFGLAVGEEAFQFEHRDLHWGNVLIAPTEQKLATFVLRGRTYRVPRRGVAATIIDYSLSRLSLPLPSGGAECAALYNDLATDEQLFDAVGDYQFEVYRLMRDKLGNDWKNFEPYTNILWLHYIVDKMITALRYKRTNTKIHKHYIEKLTAIKNSILDYESAVQFVLNNIDF